MNPLINLSDLVDYVGSGSRKYVEGENVMRANHLLFVGITSETNEKIKIMALCLKSSDLNGTPHEVSFISVINNEKQKIDCKCSCKAGQSGRCKHCVALLIHLTRCQRSDLEVATCTDIAQKWGKLKKDAKIMYDAVPVSDFCHGKQNEPMNSIKYPNCLDILLKGLPNSELAKTKMAYRSAVTCDVNCHFISPADCEKILQCEIYHPIEDKSVLYVIQIDQYVNKEVRFEDLPWTERKFYKENVCVSLESSVRLCNETQTQSSSKWFGERKIRITASTAYSFLTYLKNKQPDWNKKILNHVDNKFKGSTSTAYGSKMEQKARKCYERSTGVTVHQTGLLVNPSIPWLGYSSDGIVLSDRIIEIKCPEIGKKISATEICSQIPWIDAHNENVSIKQKHSYFCQIQIGMFVTQMKKCDVVIYSSFDDTCFIITVEFDSNLLQYEYIPKLQSVYFMYFLKHLSQTEE